MPMWRCPHCGTPQAETSRCWVCKRSSTSCGTCRNFRRSVAGQLGYCGLDARRQPLQGDELRGCWEAGAPFEPAPTITVPDHVPPRARLDFVPVGDSRDARPRLDRGTTDGAAPPLAPPATGPVLSFWGDEA